jgi:trehalose 6-phosphate synthase
VWTRELLFRLVAQRLQDFHLICIANREPYSHVFTPDGIRCTEPASGVVTALDPIMQVTGGTWIAHGNGPADRATTDGRGRLRVPEGDERYTLRRIWLTDEEENGYYYRFSNEALWPLCHIVYRQPVFDEDAWRKYVAVNEKFADAVVEEVNGAKPLIFVQDYHFALLSKLVKQRLPGAIVLQFWHIPWPNPEVFRICPWKTDLLEGLLGNDLLAFHTQLHCNNFLDTVEQEIESRVDRERFHVTLRGSTTLVRPHPISIDFEKVSDAASSPKIASKVESLRQEYGLGDRKVILGVDRLDYTKGIPERLRALDRLFQRHPEHCGKVVFFQLGMPSRSSIRAYAEFEREVEREVARLNRIHGTDTWRPAVLLKDHHAHRTLYAWYRLADVCLVTALHDGMNLVAKEFVAARSDLQGTIVLSEFTGAARELTSAILVNPFAVDATAEALHAALMMPPADQAARMERLRLAVREQNVYRWVGGLLQQAVRLDPPPFGDPTGGGVPLRTSQEVSEAEVDSGGHGRLI